MCAERNAALRDRVLEVLRRLGPSTVPEIRSALGLHTRRSGWEVAGALKSLLHERLVEVAGRVVGARWRTRAMWRAREAADPVEDAARTEERLRREGAAAEARRNERAQAKCLDAIEKQRLRLAIDRRPGLTVEAYAAELRRPGEASVLDWWYRRADELVDEGAVRREGTGSTATYTAQPRRGYDRGGRP